MPRIAIDILGVIIGLSLVAVSYYFFVYTNQPFDPEQVSAEIVNSIGASDLASPLLTGAVCGAIATGDDVCMGHETTARAARDVAQRVIARTNAKAASEWMADTTGYSRIYRYGQFDTFQIMITNDMIYMGW